MWPKLETIRALLLVGNNFKCNNGDPQYCVTSPSLVATDAFSCKFKQYKI